MLIRYYPISRCLPSVCPRAVVARSGLKSVTAWSAAQSGCLATGDWRRAAVVYVHAGTEIRAACARPRRRQVRAAGQRPARRDRGGHSAGDERGQRDGPSLRRRAGAQER
jgi:hypothetical protein